FSAVKRQNLRRLNSARLPSRRRPSFLRAPLRPRLGAAMLYSFLEFDGVHMQHQLPARSTLRGQEPAELQTYPEGRACDQLRLLLHRHASQFQFDLSGRVRLDLRRSVRDTEV